MEAVAAMGLMVNATEFLQAARISLFVYDTDKKSFVSRWSKNVPLEGFVKSRMALSGLLQPTDHGAESSNSIIFVEVPFEKHMAALGPRAISRCVAFITNDHSRSLLPEVNRTSTTGSLLCSEDRHSMLFETPHDCVPFLHLSLSGGEIRDGQRQWRAILAYEKKGKWGKYDIERHMSRIQTHEYTGNEPGAMEVNAFDAFASVMRGFLSQYISIVKEEAKGVLKAIHEVENSLASEERPSILLRQINNIGRKIRVSSLKKQFAFSIDAAEWLTEISRAPEPLDIMTPLGIERFLQSDLLLSAQGMDRYHPDRLREVLAEVHQNIEDIIAEKQQERQEQLQEQEERRKKDRYKLQDEQKAEEKRRVKKEGELLELSIRIAKETKRDSRTMRGIAWVTIAFLPATFVTSFFGMNFFNGIAGRVPFDEASRNVWLFFAIAIPVSGIVLLTFYLWDKQEKKKDERALPSMEDGSDG